MGGVVVVVSAMVVSAAASASPGISTARSASGSATSGGGWCKRRFNILFSHLFCNVLDRYVEDYSEEGDRNDGNGSICWNSNKDDAERFCSNLNLHSEVGTELETVGKPPNNKYISMLKRDQ